MKELTLRLDKFQFRIEKSPQVTVFDPVFEGQGMVSLQNISIRLQVDCAKESLANGEVPVLQIRELHVELEKVQLRVQDTGFGSDFLVNKAVEMFSESITAVCRDNLREQILEQTKSAIDSLNAYFIVNPNMILSILGIQMEDLSVDGGKSVVWV
jgi:hypothetical protein